MTTSRMTTGFPVTLPTSTASAIRSTRMAFAASNPAGLATLNPLITPFPETMSRSTPSTRTAVPVYREPYFSISAAMMVSRDEYRM